MQLSKVLATAGVVLFLTVAAYSTPAGEVKKLEKELTATRERLADVEAKLEKYEFAPDRLLPLLRGSVKARDWTSALAY